MGLVVRDDAESAPPATTRAARLGLDLFLLRAFRLYWTASIPWNLARWMEMVVAGWLMLELTNSPWQVAMLGFFRSAALPLLGPFAGVVADRVDRLTLVRLMQLLNALAPLAIAGALLAGVIAPWHLYAASLALGVSWAIDWPARRALMVDIIGSRSLVQSTVLDNLSMNASKIIGPALAGLLIFFLGATWSYLIAGLTFGLGGLLFLFVERPTVQAARLTGSALRSLTDGLAYVVRHKPILGVLLVTILMNLLVFPYTQLLPVIARDALQVGPIELGWLAAANGIGALIGLPLILRLRAGGPQGWLYIIGSTLMAATLLAFALSPSYWPALLALVLGGLGQAGFGTMQGTILLSQASPEMRGRALGVLTLAIGSSPLGALLMGVLAEQWSASISLAVCGVLGLLGMLAVVMFLPALGRVGQVSEPSAAERPG